MTEPNATPRKRSSFLPILLILFILAILVAGVGALAWWLSSEEVP
jgi:flagellar basal body-associated protein FliL